MLKRKQEQKQTSANTRSTADSPQAIVAKGNALRTITLTAAGIALVPAILGFAFLMLWREPAVQSDQIERISHSYALQQAATVQRLFEQLGQRLDGAASSPLALSAIASQSREDIRLVEQAMTDYFPELVSLRLIALGVLGTADLEGGSQGLRNHIEVDLVRRTAAGEFTLPESYAFEGRYLTSLARLIRHPHERGVTAVILATVDNTVIEAQLAVLGDDLGTSELVQTYRSSNIEKQQVVAAAGKGDERDYTRSAPLGDGPWRIDFTPAAKLVNELSINPLPLLMVLAISAVALLAALAFILLRFPGELYRETQRIASNAAKKVPMELSVPQLVDLAKELRRASQRGVRQTITATTEAPSPAPSQVMVVEESETMDDLLELDLDEAPPPAPTPQLPHEEGFPDHIFRAYDIRGLADEELTDALVSRIGRAVGSMAGEMDQQTLVVACDGRNSSPRIKTALVKALMESGRDVVDIGVVPTPLLYFATQHLDSRSGIMITGSHNPAEYNGLKIVLDQETIAAGGIQDIKERVLLNRFSSGAGRMIRQDILPAYLDEVVGDIAIAVPLKLVIDAGNGVTGPIAPQLFQELGCEVVPLYCDLDGNFPNHSPDTSDEANLSDLVAAVAREGADFGVAFDGDGDRVAIVTGAGQIVRTDRLMMLFAEDVVSRNPGADVVFDVKCSRELAQSISRQGGRPVLWKTGHAFMKEKIRETGALLGGEFSGHIFFGERWYGFDDGMYAASRLAEILSSSGDSLDEMLARYPDTVSTPEIRIPVAESEKFKVVQAFARQSDFGNGKVNTLDGVRVDYPSGWGLLRASNTGAALTARFEADSADSLQDILGEFRDHLAKVDPSLEINLPH